MNYSDDSYIDVAARIQMLKELYPEASLQPVDPLKPYTIETIKDKTYVVVVAACFRDPEDKRPGVGMAWVELPGRGFTAGSELMIAETSAWGRAIVAAIQTSTKKIASKQEVEVAQSRTVTRETLTAEGYSPYQIGRMAAKLPATFAEAIDSVQTAQVAGQTEEPPRCKHGTMLLRRGTSEKTGKDYYGYVCADKVRANQCDSDWWELGPNGTWHEKRAK